MRRGAKRGATRCLLITLCQLFVSQCCWLFLCRLLAESSPCMASGRGTAFGKLLWHCRLWVCVVFVRRLVLLLLVQYSAKINLFQLIILRQICQPYDPLAPPSLSLWPVWRLLRSLVLLRVKNYANFCLTLTFMVIRALWGRTETFLLPYLIWRSGQRRATSLLAPLCVQSFVGPILWVNIRLEYV